MSEDKKKQPVRELYNELLKYPSYINELTEYQKSRVLDYADSQLDLCLDRAMKVSSINENITPEFWLKRSFKYKEAKRVKAIIERKVKTESNITTENLNESSNPWGQLKQDQQNRITSFLAGKRKKNKECYRFLLAVLELNRDILKTKDNPAVAAAVISLAKEYDSYHTIDSKPSDQSLRDRIFDYYIKKLNK
ncbi:MAG TPA: hypothetical protein VJ964_02955 [Balneolaceae bacterium]|nr:hypothetical protein [Balneolaceae bacterium]